MTIIKKISTIAGISLATSSLGAVVSYTTRNVLSVKEKAEEKPKAKYEYDADFFNSITCCVKGSANCKGRCIQPMEIF